MEGGRGEGLLRPVAGEGCGTQRGVFGTSGPGESSNVRFPGLSEERRGLRVEFKEIMAKNFPKLTRALTHRPKSLQTTKYREKPPIAG